MKKTYNINISGTSFGIVSDEDEQHIRLIETKVNEMVTSVKSKGASSHKAALFVCVELCDKLIKLEADKNTEKKTKKPDSVVTVSEVSQTTLF